MRTRLLGVLVLASALAGCDPATPGKASAALSEPRLALVGVEWGSGSPALAFGVLKEQHRDPVAAPTGDLRLDVLREDGEPLGSDFVTAPRTCSCGAEHDHLEGDVRLPHRPVLVFRVPYRTGRERVRLWQRGEAGWRRVLEGDLVPRAQR